MGIEPLSPITRALMQLDLSNPQHRDIMNVLVQDEPDFLLSIIALDAQAPFPSDKPVSTTVYVPPLPTYAQLSQPHIEAANGVALWLPQAVQWASERSPMTPPLFLFAGFILLIAAAIARRMYVHLGQPFYPHLYVLWVAATTQYAKSTGLRCVMDMAEKAFPHLQMPRELTPEALMASLSGKLPGNIENLPELDQRRQRLGALFAAQRVMYIDEASGLLGNRKDYMQGNTEILLQNWDGVPRLERQTNKEGLIIARNMGFSLLGATTPAAMARYVTPDRWEDGEMARYVLLCPDKVMAYDDSIGSYEPPPHLTTALKRLHDRLPPPPDIHDPEQKAETLSVAMDDDALKGFQAYRRAMIETSRELDSQLHGNYGRLPTQALKVALCLAAIDWSAQAEGNKPVIRSGHWAQAQQIVETWRESLHRLVIVLNETRDSRGQTRILSTLKHSPSGLTARDLGRQSGLTTKDVNSALNVLIESGDVEALDAMPPNGGYKHVIYRIRIT